MKIRNWRVRMNPVGLRACLIRVQSFNFVIQKLGQGNVAVKNQKLLTCAAIGMILLGNGISHPILTRHDKADSLYIRLGNEFKDVVVDLRVPTPRFPNGRSGNGVGVMISSRWVLTAAHVASGLRPQRLPTPSVTINGINIQVEKVLLHPRWREEGPADIGLIKLKESVRSSRWAKPYEGNDEIGKDIKIVGWGDFGTGLTGPTTMDQRLRGATNRVDDVTEDNLIFDFDSPESNDATELEGVSGPGDSGGPALAEIKGELFVLGVSVAQDGHGRGRGRYGATEYYTKVSNYAKWIKEAMKD